MTCRLENSNCRKNKKTQKNFTNICTVSPTRIMEVTQKLLNNHKIICIGFKQKRNNSLVFIYYRVTHANICYKNITLVKCTHHLSNVHYKHKKD